MTSNYVTRPRRDLCKCQRGPVNPEYETCEHCYLDAQANVVDIETERWFREHEKIMAGDAPHD